MPAVRRVPWASGPGEILQHGLSLLMQNTETSRRLAMLSIDNAVELSIKTYLGLPRRITGLNISRKDYQEISENFPSLLDALEKNVKQQTLHGIDLGEIEWFHRLRNELYHQGNGLTIEKEKVEVYAELARLLYKTLFGYDLNVKADAKTELLGRFLSSWQEIERVMESAISTESQGGPSRSLVASLHLLYHEGAVSNSFMRKFEEQRRLRNLVVHGQTKVDIDERALEELGKLLKELTDSVTLWESRKRTSMRAKRAKRG